MVLRGGGTGREHRGDGDGSRANSSIFDALNVYSSAGCITDTSEAEFSAHAVCFDVGHPILMARPERVYALSIRGRRSRRLDRGQRRPGSSPHPRGMTSSVAGRDAHDVDGVADDVGGTALAFVLAASFSQFGP